MTDLPETLHIVVTDADCAEGIRWDGCGCPVSLAFQRALTAIGGAVVLVDVGWDGCDVVLNADRYRQVRYRFPESVSSAIEAFDTGKEMYSMEFDAWMVTP